VRNRTIRFVIFGSTVVLVVIVGVSIIAAWQAFRAPTPEAIRKHMGVTLPSSARDIHFVSSCGFVYFAFLRFDMDGALVDAFLQQNPRLPRLSSVDSAAKADLIEQMMPEWSRSSWWCPPTTRDCRLGATQGEARAPNGTTWKWEYVLCAESRQKGEDRIWIMYCEDPVASSY